MKGTISAVQAMRWRYEPADAERIRVLSRELEVGEILAELIARMEVEDIEEIRRFLYPRLKELADPFLLPNLETASRRIVRAKDKGERVVIFGDYDVDGVTSTTLLVSFLRKIGLSPDFAVPRRMGEGYGLSGAAVDRVLEDFAPDLLIAVDCGTNSRQEVAGLRAAGVDVIIVDHHRSTEALPADCIIVNPHLEEGRTHPWTYLSAVGLAFKLAHGILKILRECDDETGYRVRLKDYLEWVALGTIADLVPLTEENRILARHGLVALNASRRRGVRALFQVAGIRPGEPLHPGDISFRVGPRINASGRLADAALPVKMFLSTNQGFCEKTARQLDDYNRERQEIERRIVYDADRWIDECGEVPPGVVLFDKDWHSGVVGIVASRISRKYHRPAVVLGKEGGLAKGSGRSIPGLNLVEVLEACNDILESWGGHPLAVGISLSEKNIDAFRKRFSEAVGELLKDGIPPPDLEIAAWVELDALDEAFLDELELLHPFGQGNPEPYFGVEGAMLTVPPRIFNEAHFRFQLETRRGRRIFGVAWKKAHVLPPLNKPLDFVFRVYRNTYNGRNELQLEMIDWRHSTGRDESQ